MFMILFSGAFLLIITRQKNLELLKKWTLDQLLFHSNPSAFSVSFDQESLFYAIEILYYRFDM